MRKNDCPPTGSNHKYKKKQKKTKKQKTKQKQNPEEQTDWQKESCHMVALMVNYNALA